MYRRGDGTPRGLRCRFRIDLLAADIRRGLLPVDPAPEPTDLRFTAAGVQWRAAR